jgi:hypothetical protein
MTGSLIRDGSDTKRPRRLPGPFLLPLQSGCGYRCVLLLSVLGLDIELVSLGGAMVLSVVAPADGDVGCAVLVLSYPPEGGTVVLVVSVVGAGVGAGVTELVSVVGAGAGAAVELVSADGAMVVSVLTAPPALVVS